jgi:hypothetical protein
MNEQDLRDAFALMLTVGFAMKGEINPKAIWEIADMLVEARKPKEETGIVAVKRSSTARRSKNEEVK